MTFEEIFMAQKPKKQFQKPLQPQPYNLEEELNKQKSETREVAGRHKNDGQKDHKGAR
jgi:hypothetical protein